MAHLILTTDDNGNATLKTIKSNINYTHGNVKNIFVNYELSNVLIDDLIGRLNKIDKIIVSTLVKIRMNKGESTVNSTHLKLIKKMSDNNLSFIVVSYGSPYLDDYSFIDTYICSYGYGSVSQTAVANAIFGRRNIEGVLPINLNKKHHRGSGLKINISSSIFNLLACFTTIYIATTTPIKERNPCQDNINGPIEKIIGSNGILIIV